MVQWWLLVLFAVFLIGVTKSGFGSGVGLIIVPIAAIAMGHTPYGSQAALGLLLPLLIIGDFIALYQYRTLLFHRDPSAAAAPAGHRAAGQHSLQIIRRLLPGTAFGVVLGGLLLWWFHRQPPRILIGLIRTEIGFESILLVSIHWWRQFKGEQQHLLREPWRSHFTGGFAGTSSTLAHAAGPIIAMHLLPLHLDRRRFVAASALYFFILNTAKLPAYVLADQFASPLSAYVRIAPVLLVFAGAWFGFWVNRRLSDKLFAKLVYAVTFALGWYMLVDGILYLLDK